MRDRAYGVFDTSDVPPTCAGSPVKEEFAAEVAMDGNIVLHKIGETDLQAAIQSHLESCDLNTIMQRYAAGDESVLQRRQMLFFDASDMPTTYPEMYARLQQAERFFESQSVEFKDKYHGSWQEFLGSLDNPQNIVDLANDLMLAELKRANPAGDSLDRVANTQHVEGIGKAAEKMVVAEKMADAVSKLTNLKEVSVDA